MSKLRKILKMLVPPICFYIREKLKPRERIYASELKEIDRGARTNKMIIIVNGPSLNKSIELYKDDILRNDRICVNFFASSDLYTLLKPNNYVFADPAFWELPEIRKESILLVFEQIVDKTKWPMSVLIPEVARGSYMEQMLSENKNITILHYNNSSKDIEEKLKYQAWDINYGCPYFRNVLQLSIYLSLFWEYPETYIIGADASYAENLYIDQLTNQLYSVEPHFYKHEKVYVGDKDLNHYKGTPLNYPLYEEYRRLYLHFKVYSDLLNYADYKKLKVYNASEYSWIDTFERKKIS